MAESLQNEGFTEVFAWGTDSSGQLGLSKTQIGKIYTIPKFCSFGVIIHQIACGDDHSAFIASNGYIYTMGSNADGKLGIPSKETTYTSTPSLVESLSRYQAVRVACGRSHTTAIVDKGDLYAWGGNSEGQLGLGDYISQGLPQKVRVRDKKTGVEASLNFLDVDCGSKHTIGLTSTGDVFTMGSSEFGQLGNGSLQNEVFPIKVEFYSRIRKISAGESHTLVLTENGKIYAAGCNQSGQLGIGNRKSSLVFVKIAAKENLRFKKVSAGSFSAAFCTRGELYLWGAGVFGEFLTPQKVGEFKYSLKRLSVGSDFGCGVDSKGNIYSWGINAHGELGAGDVEQLIEPQIISSLQGKKITSVSCGRHFVIALGSNVKNREHGQEKTVAHTVPLENESRRQAEKEKLPKPELQSANENYYKERYVQIEKALDDSKHISFDGKEKPSSNLNESFGSTNGHRKNRSRSASLTENQSETNIVQQAPKRVSFEDQDRTQNEENGSESYRRQRSSSLRRSRKISQEKSQPGFREERRSKEQDSSGFQSKKKSPKKRRLQIDTTQEDEPDSNSLPTASFNVQSSDNFKPQATKEDENLDLSSKFVYERIVSADKRGRSHNSASRYALEDSIGGYYPSRTVQIQQFKNEQSQQDSKVRKYEEIIESNKEEILSLQDSVAELRRQLFEIEQNKINSIKLQEKIHGKKMDGMEDAWKEMQQELSDALAEKTRWEKVFEQEKQFNMKMASLIEEKDKKIKDLEKEVLVVTNARLQQKSEGNELEKERDYYRRRVEDLMVKLEKQQLDFNDVLSQKEEELEKALMEKKELEQTLNEHAAEIAKLTADRDQKKGSIDELLKTREELQKLNKLLAAEKELLITAKIKLENTIAGVTSNYEEKLRIADELLEEKEQMLDKQQQETQKLDQRYNDIKLENKTLAQELHEKNAQTHNLRSLLATLENSISQKNYEIQIQKTRLIETLGDEYQSARERADFHTSPGREEDQLLDDYRGFSGTRNAMSNGSRADRKLSRQTRYISDNPRDPRSANTADYKSIESPTRPSSIERRPFGARTRLNRSPERKDSRPRQDDTNESQFSFEKSSASHRFTSQDGSKEEYETHPKSQISFIGDSTIKKISKKANRLVEILESEPDSKMLEETKYRATHQPLSRRDENESNQEFASRIHENQSLTNKPQGISKTLQAVEIPLHQEESEREFYESRKQAPTRLLKDKENSTTDLRLLKNRLQNLQNNKNVLEHKMQEFENKLKVGAKS